jgi:hypothetical protein
MHSILKLFWLDFWVGPSQICHIQRSNVTSISLYKHHIITSQVTSIYYSNLYLRFKFILTQMLEFFLQVPPLSIMSHLQYYDSRPLTRTIIPLIYYYEFLYSLFSLRINFSIVHNINTSHSPHLKIDFNIKIFGIENLCCN